MRCDVVWCFQVNPYVTELVSGGLIQALVRILKDLRVCKDEDFVMDLVLLAVQTLTQLGKFIESQQVMDENKISDYLESEVKIRYSFDASIVAEVKKAVKNISQAKEAEFDKLKTIYSERLSACKKKADARTLLGVMDQVGWLAGWVMHQMLKC